MNCIRTLFKFLKKHKKAWKNSKFFLIELPSNRQYLIKSIEQKFSYNPNCYWDIKKCKTK